MLDWCSSWRLNHKEKKVCSNCIYEKFFSHSFLSILFFWDDDALTLLVFFRVDRQSGKNHGLVFHDHVFLLSLLFVSQTEMQMGYTQFIPHKVYIHTIHTCTKSLVKKLSAIFAPCVLVLSLVVGNGTYMMITSLYKGKLMVDKLRGK